MIMEIWNQFEGILQLIARWVIYLNILIWPVAAAIRSMNQVHRTKGFKKAGIGKRARIILTFMVIAAVSTVYATLLFIHHKMTGWTDLIFPAAVSIFGIIGTRILAQMIIRVQEDPNDPD